MVENIFCNTCGTEILATDKHCSRYSARQLELIHIEKKASSERLSWIDILKGIAIILVVVGHLSIYNELGLYIYSFHMPLFFFVSGYLFNMNKYYDAPLEFLKTKARALLIPYLSFTIISYIFYILCNLLLRIFQPSLLIEDLLGKGLLFKLNEIFFTQYNLY